MIFGAPFLAYLIGVAHPARLVVGESDRLFLAIHLGFPFVICLLAWALYLLVDGVENRAATAARILVIPFAVAYTAFESFAGIARGAFVWKADDLPPDRQQNAAELISSVTHSGLARPLWLTQRRSGSRPPSRSSSHCAAARPCRRSSCSRPARCSSA